MALTRKRTMASVIVTIGVAIAVISMLGSDVAKAGPGPLVVRGYIWDSVGRDLVGADVTINIRYASGGAIRATLTDTSDSNAFYSVTFGLSDWDVGDTIETIATYLSNQDSNSTTATSQPIQYVNVTFPYEIPQFGSMIGLAIAGAAVGLVAVVALVMLRRR